MSAGSEPGPESSDSGLEATTSADTSTPVEPEMPAVPSAESAEPLRTRRKWIGRGLAAVGILIILSAAWVGWRTYQAYRHLNAAASEVASLQGQIKNLDDIDLVKARSAVDGLRNESAGAVSATSDPLFSLAKHLPWVGSNLKAISQVASIMNGLADNTAPALLDVATTVQPSALAPRNGIIDVAPIAAAAGALQKADAQVGSALLAVYAIDRSDLVGPLARAVNTFQEKLISLSGSTSSAARIGRLAPAMLGADGTRRYLVVFQNLAEARATGGIFGSYALLTIDHGKLTIGGQGSSSIDLGTYDPALPPRANLPTALYGTLPNTYPTDVNLTPDFPTAASLITAMYADRTHVQLDGVLALDPVALSYLLQGAAPIEIGHDLRLTSSNVTSILLSRAYKLYPGSKDAKARDAFLAEATLRAFTSVTNSPANAKVALRGLTKAAVQHRLQLWSTHPSEQKDLIETDLGTALPSKDGAIPTIGVFRNDGTGGKLGYYASGSASLTAGSCVAGSQRQLTLTVDLSYAAPSSGLPAYVLGYQKAGPYVLRTNLLVFAPLGGDISAITVDGVSLPVTWATESGRKVGTVTIDQKPGQKTVVVARMSASAASSVATQFTPQIAITPGVTTWKTTAASFPAC
ncbi:hypothetical protein ABIB25_002245 [Nakamurella sp. UYEF19]|uniref:DUF4012 domain-containing protein n=1 Tax=Nakamurella sp. UYEF19 TaxID=1756392 RepID=UPI0033996C7A